MLWPWKNDGNAVAHSILLVYKIIRNQCPIKVRASLFLTFFQTEQAESEWVTSFSLRLVHTLCSAQCLAVHMFSFFHCSVQLPGSRLASVSSTNHRRSSSYLLCSDWSNRRLKEEKKNCHLLITSWGHDKTLTETCDKICNAFLG
jgi:hypothetical protein